MIARRRVLQAGRGAPAGLVAWPAGASDTVSGWVFDPARHRISLHWTDAKGRPYRTFQAVLGAIAVDGGRVTAITNAGIYDRDGTPLGLHVEDGVVLRPLNRGDGDGNFFLKPNGVFAMSGTAARIADASTFRLDDAVSAATQSGPLLVLDGTIHPAFRRHSESRRSRNAVGVRSDGRVVLAMTRVPVNFWDMAVFMRDRMGCPSALYLDGAISQLWRPGDPPPEDRHPYVGMLAVTER